MRLDDWRDLLTADLDVVNRASCAPLIVIDELPYLMQHPRRFPGSCSCCTTGPSPARHPAAGSSCAAPHTNPLRYRAFTRPQALL